MAISPPALALWAALTLAGLIRSLSWLLEGGPSAEGWNVASKVRSSGLISLSLEVFMSTTSETERWRWG